MITNNIRVALGAFALGITFGLGTVYLLIANGSRCSAALPARLARAASAGNSGCSTPAPRGALVHRDRGGGRGGPAAGFQPVVSGAADASSAVREEAVRSVQLAVCLIPAFVVAGIFPRAS